MGSLFAYSLSSAVVMTLLYMAYKWSMASERQHALNRATLWGIYIVSILTPSACLAYRSVETLALTEGVAIGMVDVGQAVVAAVPAGESSRPLVAVVLLWIYLAGMLFVTAHTIMVALRLAMLVRSGERIDVEGRKVILMDDERFAPFSVMNTIVMSRRDFVEAGGMIFIHESCHVRSLHWLDLLMAQVFNIFQWYSPASWLMREELRAVHEYQADAGVMASGVNVKEYQMLLIKKAVGARFPSLANSLNHSKLKKRITMMYNSPSSGARRLRSLVLVPALGTAVFVTTIPAVAGALVDASEATLGISPREVTQNPSHDQPSELLFTSAVGMVPAADYEATAESEASLVWDEKAAVEAGPDSAINYVGVVAYGSPNNNGEESAEGSIAEKGGKVYDVVETAPQYPGGMEALMKRIASNVRYPADAQRDSIQGCVVVQFVVDKSGDVVSPKVLRGVCQSIDAEALRVVTTLDRFIPGKVEGKPVAVYYTMPVSFMLTGQPSSTEEDRSKPVEWRTLGVVTSDGSTISPEGVRVFVGGKEVMSLDEIDSKTIKSVDVVKNDARYPGGAIFITLKSVSASEGR